MAYEWEEIPIKGAGGGEMGVTMPERNLEVKAPAMTAYEDLTLSLLSNLVELVRKQGEVLDDLRTILADVVGFRVKGETDA